jgi:hypothetical protein
MRFTVPGADLGVKERKIFGYCLDLNPGSYNS